MAKRLKFPKVSAKVPEGARAFRPAGDTVHAMWREHEAALQAAYTYLNASRTSLVRLMAHADGIKLEDGWAWNAEFLRWEIAPNE